MPESYMRTSCILSESNVQTFTICLILIAQLRTFHLPDPILSLSVPNHLPISSKLPPNLHLSRCQPAPILVKTSSKPNPKLLSIPTFSKFKKKFLERWVLAKTHLQFYILSNSHPRPNLGVDFVFPL